MYGPPPPGFYGPHFGPPPPTVIVGNSYGYGYRYQRPLYHDDVVCCCNIY